MTIKLHCTGKELTIDEIMEVYDFMQAHDLAPVEISEISDIVKIARLLATRLKNY